MIKFNYYSDKISKMQGKKDLLISNKQGLQAELSAKNRNLIALEKAQAFIQQVAKDTQEQIKFIISDIVQLALDTCFPNEYEFVVDFKISRGKTEASLNFMKEGIEIDPISASGGGVVDIASFALRIAAWSLGKSDNVIILDEPFRFLSKDLRPRAGEILNRISKQLNLQFIIVTHDGEIISNADKVFEVTQNKITGISKVIERSN